MIELSLTSALVLYSAIILAGAFLVWCYTEANVRRAQRLMTKQDLWRCAYCAFSYLDEEATSYSTCPRCGSINDAAQGKARNVILHLPAETPAWFAQHAGAEEGMPRRNPSRQKRPGARARGPRKRA